MIKITVCIGSSCHIKGSRKIVEDLQRLIKEYKLDDDVELGGAFCMGKCAEKGISVDVDGKFYSVLPDKTSEFFEDVILNIINRR